MKKIILYILAGLILGNMITSVALANYDKPETSQSSEKTLIAKRDYQPAIIPKPDNLPGPDASEQQEENSKTRSILTTRLLPKATTGFIGFVGMVAFLMLIIAGIRFVVAYGNTEAIEKAKNEVIYAIAGLIIALLAYTIVIIISNLEYKPTQPASTAQISINYV